MDEERNFTIEPEDEPPAQSEYTQPDYIPEWTQPTQPEEPEEPKKKRRTWLKITALLLALAIVASLGRALLRSAINGLAAHTPAAIQRSRQRMRAGRPVHRNQPANPIRGS